MLFSLSLRSSTRRAQNQAFLCEQTFTEYEMSISDFLFQAYFLTFFGEKFSYILFKGRFSIKAISSRCHKLFFAGSALKKMTFPIENLLPLLTADWAVYGMLPTLKAFL